MTPIMTVPAVAAGRSSGERLDQPPWDTAWPDVEPLTPFVLADGSGRAEQQTLARVCHDGTALYVRYECADRDIWATMTQRDDPIYQEEVVEVFLAPGSDDPTHYLEFEVSPDGVVFDTIVHNPGVTAPIELDLAWDCPDLRWGALRDDANDRWEAYFVIPFAAALEALGLPREPLPTTWRANFFRIERPRDGADELSCWSPPLTDPVQFHTPSRFGRLGLA